MASFTIALDADDTDLDRTIERNLDKLDKLQDKAASVDVGGHAMSGKTGTSGGGGLSDPWAKQTELRERYMEARRTGLSDDDVRPIQLAMLKADAAASRADRLLASGGLPWDLPDIKGGGGAGGGSSNLLYSLLAARNVGGVLKALSGLAPLAPFAAIGGAGIAALEMGSASRRDIGSAYNIGGGSYEDTAQISSIGRFLGRSASQSAGAAVAFGEALHGNTYGAGYFRSRGLVDFGGITTNKDTNYIAAASIIANEPNRDIATRVARDTGMTDELWLRNLYPSERERVFGGMMDKMTDASMHAESEYMLTKAELGSWWGRAVRGAAGAAANLKDIGMAGWDVLRGDFAGVVQDFRNIGNRADWSDDEYVTPHYEGPWKDPVYRARQRMGVLFGVQGRVTPGFSGGGPRAQSSLPAAVRGSQLQMNLDAYGQYMGGYIQ